MAEYPRWRGEPLDDELHAIVGPLATEDAPPIGPAILRGRRRGQAAAIEVGVIDREDMARLPGQTAGVSYVLVRLPGPLALLLFELLGVERVTAAGA